MNLKLENIKRNLERYKSVVFTVGLLAWIGFMAVFCTKSGFWYDEAIEYWYSKVISGIVPGGNDTVNMYQRIIFTFQPPLYNIISYLWMIVFDSEFSFRMLNVILTLIGGGGFYKTIRMYSEWKYAAVSTAVFLFATPVTYYAMECSEYSLMLALITWLLYFFVNFRKNHSLSNMIGIFLCSIASVYSQYGAIFVVLPVFAATVYYVIRGRKKKMFLECIALTFLTLIFAVMPLLYFFTIPQIQNQRGMAAEVVFSFEGNLVIDFIKLAARTFGYNVAGTGIGSAVKGVLIISYGIFAICLIMCCLKKRDKNSIELALLLLSVFAGYWLLSGFSLYAYNSYNGRHYLVRYVLFQVPVLMIALSVGTYNMIWNKAGNNLKFGKLITVGAACVIVLAGIRNVAVGVIKDDTREALAIWRESQFQSNPLLVYEHCEPVAMYYLKDTGYDSQIKLISEPSEILEYMTEPEISFLGINGDDDTEMVIRKLLDNDYVTKNIYDGMTVIVSVQKR